MWIRLSNLPSEYWNEDSLRLIGEELGSFITIDESRIKEELNSYVRLCIEIYLETSCWEELEIVMKNGIWKKKVEVETFQVTSKSNKTPNFSSKIKDVVWSPSLGKVKGNDMRDHPNMSTTLYQAPSPEEDYTKISRVWLKIPL
ncbi:hypothetical protein SUGI_0180490 [Cryptomeria japonica]|nr:hypothetical protein SUGI_0180490 [Cryptomeria japonica]